MPDDFDRLLEIAIFDGGDVAQKVVLLGRIVAQPLHHFETSFGLDEDDRRLSPDDRHPFHGQGKALGERGRGRVRLSAEMTDILRSGRCRGAGSALPAATISKRPVMERCGSDGLNCRTARPARRSPTAECRAGSRDRAPSRREFRLSAQRSFFTFSWSMRIP